MSPLAGADTPEHGGRRRFSWIWTCAGGRHDREVPLDGGLQGGADV